MVSKTGAAEGEDEITARNSPAGAAHTAAPAEVGRHLPEDQQRRDQHERVGGEDQRQYGAEEPRTARCPAYNGVARFAISNIDKNAPVTTNSAARERADPALFTGRPPGR